MIRIFTTLAIFAVLLMSATLIVGLSFGDLQNEPDKNTQTWAMVHRLMGVASALTVVLVNSIAMTYFIGTSRWCKEVTETYELDPNLVRRSTQLKRSAFPWAVTSMLVVVAVGALGAAADPATRRLETEQWVMPHMLAALAGLAYIAYAFWMEGLRIMAHHQVIVEIVAEVRKIREERGLEV